MFPEFDDFLEAMSDMWLEKLRGFEDEAERLGYSPIPAGTKASQLNKCVLAYLTESGSYLIAGPGAFEKDGPGAAGRYERIKMRGGNVLPEVIEKASGVIFGKTPKVGERAWVKDVLETSPIIMAMMRKIEEGESSGALITRTAEEVGKRFQAIQDESRLLPDKQEKK